ncbi:hypothetical protein ACGVWS_03155 [Enterobacteriaceae bacterium LUAb1]
MTSNRLQNLRSLAERDIGAGGSLMTEMSSKNQAYWQAAVSLAHSNSLTL